MAAEGDVKDDYSSIWPEDRKVVELGTLTLDGPAPEEAIIFDPVPKVAGIEPSDDPILAIRSTLYPTSSRAREGLEGVSIRGRDCIDLKS